MLKNILKLNGAQQLSKNEQKEISGGWCVNCPPRNLCYSQCGSAGGVVVPCLIQVGVPTPKVCCICY